MYRSNTSSSNVLWPDGSSVGVIQNSEIQRESIAHLRPGILKGAITAIIIAKQDPRSFVDKKNPSQMRGLLGFTVRDSPNDLINISCWGSGDFINDLAKSFRIGDAVEIKNVLVQNKLNTEAEERYNPWTPGPFNLLANETHAVIERCFVDENDFASFAFMPVKESEDYYKLGDIIANGQNLNSLHINILAVVRDNGVTKEIVTKAGKTIQKRDVLIFDETCVSFPLLIWSEELSWLADGWNPHETVLFLADVKVQFDEFRKRMTAICDGKTIITVNPDIPDAHVLYSYAQSIDLTDEQFMIDPQSAAVPLEDITDVFTIEKLNQWIANSGDENVVHGIIYGCITNFNIDSMDDNDKIFIDKCGFCKRRINRQTGSCINEKCSSLNQSVNNIRNDALNSQPVVRDIDLKIDISDVTGGIPNFRLQGKIAEKFLEHSADELLSMDLCKRTELKWKYLMDRYKIYFKLHRSMMRGISSDRETKLVEYSHKFTQQEQILKMLLELQTLIH